jgi:hypothetical protein
MPPFKRLPDIKPSPGKGQRKSALGALFPLKFLKIEKES